MSDEQETDEGQLATNYKRIESALWDAGIEYRTDLLDRFDQDADFTDIMQLGPVLGPLLRKALDEMDREEWETTFPWIAWKRYADDE